MKLVVEGSNLKGSVKIPGSKSHTIRAVAIASLAEGKSIIKSPLFSSDTLSSVKVYRSLGVQISFEEDRWIVEGPGGLWDIPDDVVDVGNSGTTMCIAMGSSALIQKGTVVLTGDHQIRRRPLGPLINALNELGANVMSTRNNNLPPIVIQGRIKGGKTSVKAISSQYLTSILINAPMADTETIVDVPLLYERPYVEMTLAWLKEHGIQIIYDAEFKNFVIPGKQKYKTVNKHIPGDFSSATFFLSAGALPNNEVLCLGLDINDTQGDKLVLEYLKRMGANINIKDNGIQVSSRQLIGAEIDLNATPDALPMMAGLSCFASGKTRLYNVPQARLKETDRISVMK
ncbi:MAG: 3-phosphoshikimate 1-carboxyvinyltransferase, partial [Candidatus Hydrogenedens sp.]